jgi:2-polyprenyl-6-methoxyphenol hydroxylase-like FAD-dependent oxidoreductase
VLISGAGVAGSALAALLGRAGHEVVVVERDQGVRSSGNTVDVRGAGFDVAERLGALPRLDELATRVRRLVIVDRRGREVAGLPTRRDPDRELEIGRADLCAVLLGAARAEADVRFDDVISGLRQDGDGVEVAFQRSGGRRFDLVVGADGAHSVVRRMAFGPEDRFVSRLGMYVATVRTPVEPLRPEVVLLHNEPGSAIALHPGRGVPGAGFFFRSRRQLEHRDRDGVHEALSETYPGDVWRNRELLDAYLAADDAYFDAVARVRVAQWSRGRITLLGDAASCVTLFGEGSSAALAGAGELADRLGDARSVADGLRRYESRHRRRVARGQRGAALISHMLVPATGAGIRSRDTAFRLGERIGTLRPSRR